MVEIITDAEKLSERAEEVNFRKDKEIIQDTIIKLKETIREKNLTGLSAVQIGVNKRVICINFNKDIRTFINPIIVNSQGIDISKEICSSIPKKKYIRPRNTRVTVCYQTPLEKIETRDFVGLAAKVIQHQIDHLDGILLSDIGLEIDGQFERATEEHKAEIIKMYLDSLDIQTKDAKEVVESDEKAKQMNDAVDFIVGVQKGEIKLTPSEIKVEKEEKTDE